MGHRTIAPRSTRITAADGVATTEVAGGEPVIVFGFTVENNTGADTGTVTVQSADASRVYLRHTMAANAEGVVVMDIPFEADAGIEVVFSGDILTNAADIGVTVYHSHPGS